MLSAEVQAPLQNHCLKAIPCLHGAVQWHAHGRKPEVTCQGSLVTPVRSMHKLYNTHAFSICLSGGRHLSL